MFWKSIVSGLSVLQFWQVWEGLMCYAIGSFIFLFTIGLVAGKNASSARTAIASFTYSIGGHLYQGFMVSLLVVYYTPLLLDVSKTLSLLLLVDCWWPVVKAGVIATIVGVALPFIPVIGKMIGPGITVFIQGVIVFRIFAGPIIQEDLQIHSITQSVYPGLWASIGFFIIAVVIVQLTLFAAGLVLATPENKKQSEFLGLPVFSIESVFQSSGPLLSVLLGGLIPVMMYARYAELSLRFAIGQ